MRLANQDWDLSLMEGITDCFYLVFCKIFVHIILPKMRVITLWYWRKNNFRNSSKQVLYVFQGNRHSGSFIMYCSPLIVNISIKALFLSKILSATLIREFLMLFLTLVPSCIPLRKRFSNKARPIYPLSAHSFPIMFSKNLPCFKVHNHPYFQVWTWSWESHLYHWLSGVTWNEAPMEHFPRLASPANVL